GGLRAEEICRVRGGVPNAVRVWREGREEGNVFFIGGEAANRAGGTRDLLKGAVREVFPTNRLTRAFFAWNRLYPDNASSIIETFRAMSSPAATSRADHWPCVVLTVIELAAEDIGKPEAQVHAALEGLIRRTRQQNPGRDLALIYPADGRFVAEYRAGREPAAVCLHERLAEHYQIPSLNLARAAAKRETWQDTPAQRKTLLQEGVAALLREDGAPQNRRPVRHPCPGPLRPGSWSRATLVNYERGELDPGGWLGWQQSPLDQIFHVAVCEKPGPVMSLSFAGDAVGVYGVTGPDAGDLEWSLDNGPWQKVEVFDRTARDDRYHLFHTMADWTMTNGEHTVRLRVAEAVPPGSRGRMARIGWFLVNGRDAGEISRMPPVALADTLFLQLEPITYKPPQGRWSRLPKTLGRLRAGGTVRMVMLGDSIINNIQSSHFEKLIERAYPGSRIEKIVSVRGSTGCWYYQEPEHLRNYVLRHKPDLLVIGGISQKGDVEAIRSVIRQTRAALPEVEVAVMTDVYGTIGRIDIRDPKVLAETDPNGDGYRERLLRMAQAEQVEYVNLTRPWAQFLCASKQPVSAFMSDAVHANARGCQLIGRFLELYFAPDGWDAARAAKQALDAVRADARTL
ncbi:MAG: SGNH/GDSL hydrolase family protein, partial [Kiritimatiellia bacterium]|nr:SGNH/GDSL hydrolase family protein [Kiritimatiellia bacterium]